MEAYREAQKEKWRREKEKRDEETAASSASSLSVAQPYVPSASSAPAPLPSPSPAIVTSSSSTGAASISSVAPSTRAAAPMPSAETASAASSDSRKPFARRVHILPIGSNTSLNSGDQRRLDLLAPTLREKRLSSALIKTGLRIQSSGHEFIIVKAEPDESVLGLDTDYYVEGDPVVRYDKVQFVCLWDFQSNNIGTDPSELFNNYISPYFKSVSESGANLENIVTVGETLKIFDLDFQVVAADPCPPEIGIIDTNTVVFVDWDGTPEFSRIHIVPFQDTLPHAYEFDVFNDYLKPYLTRNKHAKFNVNDQFTYQGVQFKVVCCEPSGPARIGRNTTIYCEGVLHPSLRNLLPPELLEQLSHLPPGLQMLLLNTEALAGGYEERLMEVQEMLSRRRGLANETIDRLEHFRWGNATQQQRQLGQEQCMVCLSNFVDEDDVRRLPCSHVFHASCIDEWLRRCTDCPICKANVDRAVRQY